MASRALSVQMVIWIAASITKEDGNQKDIICACFRRGSISAGKCRHERRYD